MQRQVGCAEGCFIFFATFFAMLFAILLFPVWGALFVLMVIVKIIEKEGTQND